MGEFSKIEWCTHTFNPWIGCAKVSDGCKFCYAETLMDTRYGRVEWGVNGTRVRTSDANWRKPLAWNRAAEKAGRRVRVFCASLADVFEDRPELVAWRQDLYDLIEATPHLDWLLLTKRPENVMGLDSVPVFAALDNVWIGTSVEDQAAADERIPHLLWIPARVRFLSMEPLLGPVDIGRFLGESYSAIWVIVGGESGPKARPMHPAWVRSIRDQCVEAGVPFLFKQWGEYVPTATLGHEPRCYVNALDGCVADEDTAIADGGSWTGMDRVGKHAAGRMLDGREWNEFPAGIATP